MSLRRLSFILLMLVGVVGSNLAQTQSPVQPQQSTSRSAHAVFLATSAQFLKDMDRKKAREGYRNVIQIDSAYGPAWFNLGALAESFGEWAVAKADFDKYLSVAPGGRYAQRAQRELKIISQRAASPNPTKQQLYARSIDRAQALLGAKFYKESVEEATVAQSIDSSRWEAYAVVAMCMARQNKTQEAEKFAALAADHAPAEKRDQVRSALSSNGSLAAR